MYLIDPVSLIEGTIPSLNNVSFTWVHACQGTSQVALVVKNLLACWCRRHKRTGFSLWVRKILWRWKWQPTRALLPGESMDRGAWWATVHRVAESDMTEVAQRACHIQIYHLTTWESLLIELFLAYSFLIFSLSDLKKKLLV